MIYCMGAAPARPAAGLSGFIILESNAFQNYEPAGTWRLLKAPCAVRRPHADNFLFALFFIRVQVFCPYFWGNTYYFFKHP